MAKPEPFARLKDGVTGWNEWRREHAGALHQTELDLGGANLRGANLRGANLREVNLSGAHLREARLNEADLSAAHLEQADLRGAHLRDARLRGAGLSRANLRESDLRGTDLSEAYLDEADLSEADLGRTDLRGANLRGTNVTGARLVDTVFMDIYLDSVVGLDKCYHAGPSLIDHRTLTKSGPLPLVFLRGCGLPDTLIDYLPSLLNQPIQFYSCFISYSTKDGGFADRLCADLQNRGVRCWFAPHDIAGGKKLHEQIDEAIRLYDRLLVILSQHSMNSEWVKTEIANARKRERKEQRRMLFPVRLVDFDALRDWECFDADTGKDSAREIREFFIPDFSKWETNHKHYQSALERLLKDLKLNSDVRGTLD